MSDRVPLVSAIVPSYNYVATVGAAVESVLAQTFQDLEVVIVDDASTDGARDLLRERYGAHPRVRLHLFDENGGVSVNFNRGLRLARGRYVAYCCSDDVWLPAHLATVVPALEAAPEAALAYARAELVDETGRPVPDEEEEEGGLFDVEPDDRRFFERLVRGANFVPFVATLFRRDLALARGGFREDLRILQDHDLWLRLSARHEARHADAVTVKVCWHGKNASRRGALTSERRRRDAIAMYERLLAEERDVLRAHGLERAARQRLASAFSKLARRVEGADEARACYRRAIAVAPWRAVTYLQYLRCIVGSAIGRKGAHRA